MIIKDLVRAREAWSYLLQLYKVVLLSSLIL